MGPDVRVISFDKVLLSEIKNLMSGIIKHMMISYDTTFNLTGFYVSVLVLKHPLLSDDQNNDAVIPLIYFYHELKNEEVHKWFFSRVNELLPNLESCCFFVTDEELAIRNGIRVNFPSIKILRCWNHLWSSMKRWILSHGGNKENDRNLAKFALIKFDAYNPYTGITTNISESMLDYILNLIFKILLFKV